VSVIGFGARSQEEMLTVVGIFISLWYHVVKIGWLYCICIVLWIPFYCEITLFWLSPCLRMCVCYCGLWYLCVENFCDLWLAVGLVIPLSFA
jgi:hypothetical protein